MAVEQCKRLHQAQFRVSPLTALAGLAALLFLVLGYELWTSHPPPESLPAAQLSNPTQLSDLYVGTWQIMDPTIRQKQGVSFLMIARDHGNGGEYLVESARNREVFRFRDGRLIHDTVTILYNDARDTIRHSNLGEMSRKQK